MLTRGREPRVNTPHQHQFMRRRHQIMRAFAHSSTPEESPPYSDRVPAASFTLTPQASSAAFAGRAWMASAEASTCS